jgi:hypothetical protein
MVPVLSHIFKSRLIIYGFRREYWFLKCAGVQRAASCSRSLEFIVPQGVRYSRAGVTVDVLEIT